MVKLFDKVMHTYNVATRRVSDWVSIAQGKTSKTEKFSDRTPAASLPLEGYASVIIPALNEEKRIAEVVAFALADPATAEVVVVDDSSIDRTAQLAREAGARVITSSMLGKGASMADAVAPAKCAILVYLDGDLTGLRSGLITNLCAPILREEADFVKARFGRGSGRVTELTAKPMLKIFFPELTHFAQPLGGIIAARKSLLQTLTFEDGYGVDIGLLIDSLLVGAKLAEVDIGSLEHDSQSLHDLTFMANEVGRVIFGRARAAGRLHVEQVVAMYETQRQAASGIDYVLLRRRNRQRLLLLDMDGTVTPSRFALELARAVGSEPGLIQIWQEEDADAMSLRQRVAKHFQYVHKRKFEEVARALPLRPGVIEFVNQMRRRGFMVGVISDSYFVAADIVRRRLFADFAMAHTMVFEADVSTGRFRTNPAFLPEESSDDARDVVTCKSHVLRRFLADESSEDINLTWVVGDNDNDMALMQMADKAFAIDPKSAKLFNDPKITVVDSFEELLTLLPNHEMIEEPHANQSSELVS